MPIIRGSGIHSVTCMVACWQKRKIMFRNYLKSALRNLNRNRTYSFLNIFGLATGMAASIVILLFVFNSLHYKIEPLFLFNETNTGFSRLSVKINGRQASQAIAFIQSTWKNLFPEYPFEYQFLDDHFKEIYRTDAQISQMVAIMAGLAILISCLGLFGLASFSAEKRTKEIGIRKILGASVNDVVFLLSKHYIGLVLIANLIAWPLAWLALHRWIQDYAYRVAISWWVFVLAGVAALLIALVTVSFHAVKAALSNPVKTLRSE